MKLKTKEGNTCKSICTNLTTATFVTVVIIHNTSTNVIPRKELQFEFGVALVKVTWFVLHFPLWLCHRELRKYDVCWRMLGLELGSGWNPPVVKNLELFYWFKLKYIPQHTWNPLSYWIRVFPKPFTHNDYCFQLPTWRICWWWSAFDPARHSSSLPIGTKTSSRQFDDFNRSWNISGIFTFCSKLWPPKTHIRTIL